MIQLTRLTYNDDKDGSTRLETMICSSIDTAREIILTDINKGFDGVWDSLEEAANKLSDELLLFTWDKETNTLHWYDNGIGETYAIARVDENAVNTKWQYIGSLS